jgi:N-methylhydantoinase A/oxoprolinase/acetone carboxylase beta subunit
MAADRELDLGHFLSLVDIIVHGTTVTTNAVLTGNTARTGQLTTRGFRDALEMRRGIREETYDNKAKAAEPLVPRWLRLPVSERSLRKAWFTLMLIYRTLMMQLPDFALRAWRRLPFVSCIPTLIR